MQMLEIFLKKLYHIETKMLQLTERIYCTNISEFFFLIQAKTCIHFFSLQVAY